jgi:hypothetical protein
MTEPVRCDFCSAPDVRWAFPCRDHEYHPEQANLLLERNANLELRSFVLSGASFGPWAACPACKTLILRGDRVRLARRSAKRMIRNNPDLPMILSNVTAMVRRRHDQFWENREGPPYPVTPDWRPPS